MADGLDDATDTTDDRRIRRFRASDADAAVALHRRALSHAGTDPDDVPGTQDLRWVEAAYIETGGEFLVVEASGGGNARSSDDATAPLVAMGGLLVEGAVGELSRIAVDPDYHRSGYGTALLDRLEATARDRGVERLELTTASRQESALAFYESRGYEETGRERHGEYELVRFAKPLR